MDSSATGSVTARVLDRVARDGSVVTVVWRPEREVSFGPRDRNHPAYVTVVDEVRAHGFSPVERSMGGRPVAMHRECLALVVGFPAGGTIRSRYRVVADAVEEALHDWGLQTEQSCVPASFCPGEYSLVGTGKVAGFAQRVRTENAAVGGFVIVCAHDPIVDVLAPIYDLLELPFEPGTVGSLERSGLDHTAEELLPQLEDHLAREMESVDVN